MRHRVLAVVEELEEVLPCKPRVRFDGPIDTLVDDEVANHLVPVIREALTNVARHAQATDVRLELTVVGGGLVVRVRDDGVGLPPELVPGFGLGNLRERAAALGGTLTVSAGAHATGTVLEWALPPR